MSLKLHSGRGRCRIIAGKWRGHSIPIFSHLQLRPTPDRIRETLFNWLQLKVPGSFCLDLFAGSGMLGFESLSRGAAHLVAVERDPTLLQQLAQTAERLAIDNIDLVCKNAEDYISQTNKRFDIIFLDPPFRKDRVEHVTRLLDRSSLASVGTMIYIEAEKELSPLPIPQNWQVLHSKVAGQIGYHLLQVY